MDREHIVNGKRVTFRESYPVRECHDVPYLWYLANQPDATFEDKAKVLGKLIESWEFDGAPGDIAAYESMHTFAEFWPLWTAAIIEIGQHLDAEKN
jgi:hypothetical protein